ncbi:MAG: 50S ribosomal protein L25 [Patescibacteria group bacterium]|nr:50S ribosomal protein L25 [Patescibacteria group bacterium]
MTKKFILKAETRKDKKKINELIKKGFVPAVIYGGKGENQNLKIKKNEFIKIYEGVGESSLVDLIIDDKDSIKSIVKDVQIDSIKDTIRHIDFFRIDMNVPIEIDIPLEFIGSDKAIKDLGGMVLTNLETINAKCLPGNLIENLEVNLDKLKTLNDTIHIKDLDIPDSIEIFDDENTLIVSTTLPTQEKEEEIVEEDESEKTETADATIDKNKEKTGNKKESENKEEKKKETK